MITFSPLQPWTETSSLDTYGQRRVLLIGAFVDVFLLQNPFRFLNYAVERICLVGL